MKKAAILAISACVVLGSTNSIFAAETLSEGAKQAAQEIMEMRKDYTEILRQNGTGQTQNDTSKNTQSNNTQQVTGEVFMAGVSSDPKIVVHNTEDSSTGPGAGSKELKVEIKDSDNITGPKVNEVTMGETYHSDYDVYTESIEGRFFIYTNVGNNGITDKQVYLDIPGNISFRAEKDGVPMAYTSKQNIGENGTYIFYFTAVKDPTKPLSEQITYETTFNFRIQPKAVKETENSNTYSDSYGGGYYGYGETRADDSSSLSAVSKETGYSDDLGDLLSESIEETEETEKETETETVEETVEETKADDQIKGKTVIPKSENTVSYTQTYDSLKGLYEIVPEDQSFAFYSSVPNGMLTGSAVMFDTAKMGSALDKMVILKNGMNYELPTDGVITDKGIYEITIPDGEGKLTFGFRILTGSCSDLNGYTVPAGFKTLIFTRDDKNLIPSVSGNTEYLDLQKDGSYQVEMTDGISSFRAGFVIDHEAPEFEVNINGQSAEIVYQSDDIEYVEITHKGKTESYSSITTLNGSGTYKISVYDEAGNCTTKEIKIPFKLNVAAILSVLLVVAMLVGTIIFVRRTKNNFNVK